MRSCWPTADNPPQTRGFDPPLGGQVVHAGWGGLLTDIDPRDGDLAFGLYDLGLGFPELATVRRGLGLPVERDLHFIATKPTSEFAREARLGGRIVA